MTHVPFIHIALARTMVWCNWEAKGNIMSEERRVNADMGEPWMSQPEFLRL